MSKGRHAKPKTSSTTKQIAVGASVLLGGSVVPVAFAGPASAATVDEWDRVARCESNGQWSLPGGDRDSTGGLQFRTASWSDALKYLRSQGVDTSSYPSVAYQASKEQQIMAGEALLALQGPRAWSVTFNGGAHCGNAAAGALSSGSMFKGGPDPFGGGTPASSAPKHDHSDKKKDRGKKKGHGHTHHHSAKNDSGGGGAKGHDHYTVKPGDTLWGITAKITGDRSKDNWEPLYAANRHPKNENRVENPHLIRPGQELNVPHDWSDKGDAAPTKKKAAPSAPAPKADPAPASSGDYVLPTQGRVGQSSFTSGSCISRSCGGHSGLDISAPTGTPVVSAAAGTVVAVNSAGAAYGIHVVVKHGDGVYTLYAHLSAERVSIGQNVSAGQQIGNVGSTGNSSGPHLHFEVRNHPTNFSPGVFSNPLTWLRSHGVNV